MCGLLGEQFFSICRVHDARLCPSRVSAPPWLQGCSSAMFFEARKRKDCYLWLSKVPSGPTAKFLIVNGAARWA